MENDGLSSQEREVCLPMMDIFIFAGFAVLAALLGAAVAVIFLLNKKKQKVDPELLKRIETLESIPRATRDDIKSLDARLTTLEKASLSQGTKLNAIFKKFMNLENLVKRGGSA